MADRCASEGRYVRDTVGRIDPHVVSQASDGLTREVGSLGRAECRNE
jgi:hypothetical protein